MYIYFNTTNENGYKIAAIILAISGITDMLDGFIARKFNMITELGKLLDPCADKLTQFAIAICLAYRFPLMRLMVIIIIIKDSIMAGACAYIYSKKGKKMNGAKWYGKINTIIFYFVVITLIFFVSIPRNIADLMITISIIFMVIAMIDYIVLFVKMFRHDEVD